MDLNINKLKELITNDHLKSCLTKQLELIILVDSNYEHIQQLETLCDLFTGGLSPYYKEYHKDQEFIVLQCAEIANNTFRSHYNDEFKALNAYSLYKELLGENEDIRIPSYKDKYYESLSSSIH